MYMLASHNVLSISGCAVHAFIISNFVFVIFINRKTFQRGQLTHHWMTFAQNWLIMMKVVMVGADDSGLRSTCDDGVALIMTYLLLFRQWMFLYSCWINSPYTRRLTRSQLLVSNNDIQDFAKCQFTRKCKINLSIVRHLSPSNFNSLLQYKNIYNPYI